VHTVRKLRAAQQQQTGRSGRKKPNTKGKLGWDFADNA
jgi:hypothetical protein